MTNVGRIARNTISSYGRAFISLAVLFVLTPVIIREAGQEDYGLWSLTFAILGILGLLDMAGMAGVVKWVAECRGSGDIERRNRILSTVGVVYLVISFVALALVAIFALFYNQLFDIPDHLADKSQALLWLLAIRQVILAVPFLLFKGILFGEQHIVLVNGVQTMGTVIYGVAGYAVLHGGGGIVGLAWVNLGAMLIEHISYLFYALRRVPDLELSRRLAERGLLREVLSFSAAQLVINISNLVRLRTDLILVRFFVSLAVVPTYAIALRLAEAAYYLIKQFINVLSPLHAQLAAAGEGETLRAMLVHVAKFSLAPVVMGTCAMYVLGTDAIIFWAGPEFADAGPLLHILLTSLVLGVPPLLAFTLLGMTGHHRLTARAAALAIGVNLAASIVLVFPLGMRGIALGTLVSTIVVDIALVLRWACAIHHISLATQVFRVFLPVLWPGLLQTAITYGLAQLWPPTGLLHIVILCIPGAAVYLACFWFLGTERLERDLIRQWLHKRRAARRPA